MKEYQEIRAHLIDMLEDLEDSLDEISKVEKISTHQIDKESIEIEKVLLSDRFNTVPGKINSK